MAKTQADYEAEGLRLFAQGAPHPGGSSWQRKAMAKGWNEAHREACAVAAAHPSFAAPLVAVRESLCDDTPPAWFKRETSSPALALDIVAPNGVYRESRMPPSVAQYAREEYMPHGTAAHIADLERQLSAPRPTGNLAVLVRAEERADRLRGKISALEAKYALRFVRQTGDISARI